VAPLPSLDPQVKDYNMMGFNLLPKIIPDSDYKTLVSDFIYEHVEKFVGDARAA